MFRFKKNQVELEKDLKKYIDNLDFEEELIRMNILPDKMISSQKISLKLESKPNINEEIYYNSVKNNNALLKAE